MKKFILIGLIVLWLVSCKSLTTTFNVDVYSYSGIKLTNFQVTDNRDISDDETAGYYEEGHWKCKGYFVQNCHLIITPIFTTTGR